MQRYALVADLSDQKYWLADRFVQSQGQLVFPQGLFNDFANLRFYAEKTVRRHAVADSLVGPEMVVMGDEVGKALLASVRSWG